MAAPGRMAKAKQPKSLDGWQEIAEFLGQPSSVAQRWAKSGMPVTRQGRRVHASPDDLNRWLGLLSSLGFSVLANILVATEFLRRFFLHVLPRGFVRIRHFGFLANRFRASRLALSRQLLSRSAPPPVQTVTGQASSEASSLWHCPRCGATMIVMQRFTAAELSTCSYFDSS
jgi:hypothetical protein